MPDNRQVNLVGSRPHTTRIKPFFFDSRPRNLYSWTSHQLSDGPDQTISHAPQSGPEQTETPQSLPMRRSFPI